MAKLLMISGDRGLAAGKRGAFYNTMEEFHRYWERVDIICPQVKSKKLKAESLFGNVFIHSSPWPLIFQPWWILKKGRQIFREQSFDLITVHEYPPFYNGIGARILWNKIRVPYILEIFHIPGYPKAASLKEIFYRWLTRLFVRFDAAKAKAVRVMNKKETPEFLTKAGVPKEKIAYIPAVYVDLETFKPMNLPKEYDLIFVGRLEKNKGVTLLLDAARKLKAQILNFKMIVVGEGSLKNYLKLKIENLKLQDNVVLRDWANDQQEVARLISQSKILGMASYNEGGPRVAVEAMACGVPVLATPVGVVPDLEETGALEMIDWNAEDIFEKARNLLTDSFRYGELSRLGLETAKKFEKKEAVKNYAEKLKRHTG